MNSTDKSAKNSKSAPTLSKIYWWRIIAFALLLLASREVVNYFFKATYDFWLLHCGDPGCWILEQIAKELVSCGLYFLFAFLQRQHAVVNALLLLMLDTCLSLVPMAAMGAPANVLLQWVSIGVSTSIVGVICGVRLRSLSFRKTSVRKANSYPS